MTNLYDFLRNIHDRATIGNQKIGSIRISPEEIQWIEQFLTNPDRELHFKGTKVPDPPGQENTFAQSFAVKGHPQEVFEMVVEAMLQSPALAAVIIAARSFYFDHCTMCPECMEALHGTVPNITTWHFKPHKPV